MACQRKASALGRKFLVTSCATGDTERNEGRPSARYPGVLRHHGIDGRDMMVSVEPIHPSSSGTRGQRIRGMTSRIPRRTPLAAITVVEVPRSDATRPELSGSLVRSVRKPPGVCGLALAATGASFERDADAVVPLAARRGMESMRRNLADLPINHREDDRSMELRLTYVGIRVRDMQATIRFYTETLGMEVIENVTATPPTHGQVATLKSPGSPQLLELNWYEPDSRFGKAYANGDELDHLAFECADVSVTVAELERKGVEIEIRPREIGDELGWTEAFIRDPNGIWIELIPMRLPPAPAG